MRKADVFMHGSKAGVLTEIDKNREYQFEYSDSYSGPPISVTMPAEQKEYRYGQFPPFFEGLLPEGANLDLLLRINKIDRNDLFKILLAVGNDTVGAVTVKETTDEKIPE